jgi:hypothetical protein
MIPRLEVILHDPNGNGQSVSESGEREARNFSGATNRDKKRHPAANNFFLRGLLETIGDIFRRSPVAARIAEVCIIGEGGG